jgi:hypothetical protein
MNPDVQWVWNSGAALGITGVILFLLYVAISLYHLKQVHFAPYRILTETVKFLGALLLLLTVLRPEIHTRSVRDEEARMAVILDRTDSMLTQDLDSSEGLRSRQDALRELQTTEAWRQLAEEVELDVIEMGHPENSSLKETDIGLALAATRDMENLAAVLVLSDGGHNAEASPLAALLNLAEANVPVYSVEMGSRERLPDLALVSATFPSYSILNEALVVPFTVRNSLPEDVPVQVELIADGEVVAAREIDVDAGDLGEGTLRWVPTRDGTAALTVRVQPHPAERLPENNERSSRVDIRKTEIRVLVIDSLPRWEIRFLRNALNRDPGVVVDTLFYHPELEPQSAPGLLAAFPQERDVWSEYDVVFLGDVGLGNGELSESDLENLASLVRQQGSGLVFLPGPRGGQLRLQGTVLEALMPVELDPGNLNGFGSEIPMQMSLTREGKTHMLTQLSTSSARSQQIWRRLPGFHWFAGVSRVRVGSEVLATHRSRRNENGRIPLLATRDAGTGHVLFMGTDGAWRWRRGVEDLYHYRFWGQVVRWMAHKRNMFGEDGARVFLQPERPRAGQEVTLTLSLRGGSALEGEIPFQLRLRHESGQVRSPSITELEGGGTYQARWTPDQPGEVTLELLENDQPGGTPWYETVFRIEGEQIEQIGEPVDPALFQEMADLTEGDVVFLEAAAPLLDRLRELPRQRKILTVNRLWQKPWWVVLLFTFFGLYWILRKRQGWI